MQCSDLNSNNIQIKELNNKIEEKTSNDDDFSNEKVAKAKKNWEYLIDKLVKKKIDILKEMVRKEKEEEDSDEDEDEEENKKEEENGKENNDNEKEIAEKGNIINNVNEIKEEDKNKKKDNENIEMLNDKNNKENENLNK